MTSCWTLRRRFGRSSSRTTSRSSIGSVRKGSRGSASARGTISLPRASDPGKRHIRATFLSTAREALPCRDAEGDRPHGRAEGVHQPLFGRAWKANRREPAECVPADPRDDPGRPGGPGRRDPSAADPPHAEGRRSPAEGIRGLPAHLRGEGDLDDLGDRHERPRGGRLLHAPARLQGPVPKEALVRAVRGDVESEDPRGGPGEAPDPSGEPGDRDLGLRSRGPHLRRREMLPRDIWPYRLRGHHANPHAPHGRTRSDFETLPAERAWPEGRRHRRARGHALVFSATPWHERLTQATHRIRTSSPDTVANFRTTPVRRRIPNRRAVRGSSWARVA